VYQTADGAANATTHAPHVCVGRVRAGSSFHLGDGPPSRTTLRGLGGISRIGVCLRRIGWVCDDGSKKAFGVFSGACQLRGVLGLIDVVRCGMIGQVEVACKLSCVDLAKSVLARLKVCRRWGCG